jgi:hypothetical protein
MSMELNSAELCQFIEIDYGLYLCQRCGIRVESYDGHYPILICSVGMKEGLEGVHESISTLKSLYANSTELCTDEEITQRLDICQACEFFNAKQSVCDKCGCFLSKQRQFINKLALSEASCPIGKWS